MEKYWKSNMNFDVLADTLYVLYITLKAKSQKNFWKCQNPRILPPLWLILELFLQLKCCIVTNVATITKMNISEYIHKMTTNHSLQQSQFFLSRGNSGRTENNNHKGAKLASATVQRHWLYFCLAWKVCYKNLPRNFPISFEASKWH